MISRARGPTLVAIALLAALTVSPPVHAEAPSITALVDHAQPFDAMASPPTSAALPSFTLAAFDNVQSWSTRIETPTLPAFLVLDPSPALPAQSIVIQRDHRPPNAVPVTFALRPSATVLTRQVPALHDSVPARE